MAADCSIGTQACDSCAKHKPLSSFSYRRDISKYRTVCRRCRAATAASQRYGITVGEVEALRDKQRNTCAICGIHATDIQHKAFIMNPLVIDHCHRTKRVRGLLCPPCNCAIGLLQDDPERVLKAYQYLTAVVV